MFFVTQTDLEFIQLNKKNYRTTVVSIITQHFSEDSAFRILLICIKLSLAFTDPTDKYFVLIEHFRGAQIYWFAFTEAGVRCSHCRSQLSNIGWFLLRNWQLQLQWIRATGNWYVMAPSLRIFTYWSVNWRLGVWGAQCVSWSKESRLRLRLRHNTNGRIPSHSLWPGSFSEMFISSSNWSLICIGKTVSVLMHSWLLKRIMLLGNDNSIFPYL